MDFFPTLRLLIHPVFWATEICVSNFEVQNEISPQNSFRRHEDGKWLT